MRRFLAVAALLLAAQASTLGSATAAETYNLVLAGGPESNSISIQLSADGRSYVIDSGAPLEVGSSICSNAPGNPTELVCQATAVASIEVNAGAGDDTVVTGREISIPVGLRGGPGNDTLVGGGGGDRLVGGGDDDRLVGRAGNDSLYGGDGNDTLIGCSGDDVIRGGPGTDIIHGGSGINNESE
jgi:Ca2+-binding RTX toxin-like protein